MFSLVLLLPGLGSARIWSVDTAGTGDALTIQAAADSCAPGDEILVGPGTYSELVALPARVTLRSSAGAGATTIDGGTEMGNCITIESAEDNLIEGLRFVGARWGYGFGGFGLSARGDVTIRECVFENDVSHGIGALGAIECTGDLTLQDSEIRYANGIFFAGTSLTIEGCLFEDNSEYTFPAVVQITWQGIGQTATSATVRRNVFSNNAAVAVGFDFLDPLDSLELLVEDNLFVANAGPALSRALVGVTRSADASGETVAVEFRQNTIARHPGFTVGDLNNPIEVSLTLIANAITGNGHAPVFYTLAPPPVIECNNVWGNDAGWIGIADPIGTNGNISKEPKYCGAKQGNFTVASNSVLHSTNNTCAVRIGAFDVGCGSISVTPVSWGQVKARYRSTFAP